MGAVQLPSGRRLDLRRKRSAGPLDGEELAYCREQGLELAYDPAQIGWVLAHSEDDFSAEGPDLSVLARERFETLSQALFERYEKRELERADLERELPKLVEEAVRLKRKQRSDPSDIELLRSLQREGVEKLSSRIVPAQEQAQFRSRVIEQSRDLGLRPWRFEDVGRFVELLDNPLVWEHLPEEYPNPLDEEMAESLIALSSQSSHHEVLAVEFEGEVIGQVRLTVGTNQLIERARGSAEISCWLGEAHWGRGIMSRLFPFYTLRAFEAFPLAAIFARVSRSNTASCRMVEKSGYLEEGSFASELTNEPEMKTYWAYRRAYLESPSR